MTDVQADRDTGRRTGLTRAPVDYVWALARLAIAWIFVWAFLDKLFGLGHETKEADSWLNGGSPTEGFLSNAATGPFEDIYKDIAGAGWADWLFMLGLAGIGGALLLGVCMRLATFFGVILLLMMWSAVLPPNSNPFMDDHIVYAIVLVGLAMVGAEDTLGFGCWWGSLPFVQRWPWLK